MLNRELNDEFSMEVTEEGIVKINKQLNIDIANSHYFEKHKLRIRAILSKSQILLLNEQDFISGFGLWG